MATLTSRSVCGLAWLLPRRPVLHTPDRGGLAVCAVRRRGVGRGRCGAGREVGVVGRQVTEVKVVG